MIVQNCDEVPGILYITHVSELNADDFYTIS